MDTFSFFFFLKLWGFDSDPRRADEMRLLQSIDAAFTDSVASRGRSDSKFRRRGDYGSLFFFFFLPPAVM